jgi:hypothetical protein
MIETALHWKKREEHIHQTFKSVSANREKGM